MSATGSSGLRAWLRSDAKGGMVTFLIEAAIVVVGAIFAIAVAIVVLRLV